MNLKLEEQLLVKWLLILIILIKVYLVKMGPIFDGSHTSCVTRYQKILSVCSLRSKNVLNSTWFPMIFHNRHHTTKRARLGCAAGMLPTLQGINEREGAFLTVPFLLGQKTLDVDDMLASVLLLHDKSEANEVRQHYFRNAPISWETADRLTAAISDALFVHPFHRMLQQHTVQCSGKCEMVIHNIRSLWAILSSIEKKGKNDS